MDVAISNKRYFTIAEISACTGVKAHVLRYWEQEFTQLQPTKRANRRYYQKKDLVLVLQIKQLLKQEGYTITGARNYLASLKPQEKRHNAMEVAVYETIESLNNIIEFLQN
jgi:DNA-binding transcriptional MerR regulator